MKLDWFAGSGIRALRPAAVINGLQEASGRVSDHDPIVLSFSLIHTPSPQPVLVQ